MTNRTIARIIIADDHDVYRLGLKHLINSYQEKYHVVADAPDGQELLKKMKEYQADVVLTDIKMPNLNGLEATKCIRKYYPEIRIIALSSFEENCIVQLIMESGANGYVLKTDNQSEICQAIDAVLNGETYFSNTISNHLLTPLFQSSDQKIKKPQNSLTEKELKIIQLICKQYTNKAIAYELNLSLRTIEDYIKSIKWKSNSLNTVGISLWAVKNRIVDTSI
jgi:DNA-binding NarL/FixJ family response regulator